MEGAGGLYDPVCGAAAGAAQPVGGEVDGRDVRRLAGAQVLWRGLQRLDDLVAMYQVFAGRPSVPRSPPVFSNPDDGERPTSRERVGVRGNGAHALATVPGVLSLTPSRPGSNS